MVLPRGKQIQHSVSPVEEARVCAMRTREFSVQPIDKGDTHRKAKAINRLLINSNTNHGHM